MVERTGMSKIVSFFHQDAICPDAAPAAADSSHILVTQNLFLLDPYAFLCVKLISSPSLYCGSHAVVFPSSVPDSPSVVANPCSSTVPSSLYVVNVPARILAWL